MNRAEREPIVAKLQERPGVWRLVYSMPLSVLTARRAGRIARSLRFHEPWETRLIHGRRVEAKSVTTEANRARVWARWTGGCNAS
jgi:hypothetical protein